MLYPEKLHTSKTRWKAIVGIVMVSAGCICFVLSCVATMIIAGKDA